MKIQIKQKIQVLGKEISELIDNLNFENNNNNIIIIINEDNKNESKLFDNNENVELKI